ncbi:MAG: hypothetical protein HC815_15920 [Richelia sp. RM1_1_1]|nr:hypothetical protein [Richelia sp. RM1_1_1]
MQCRQEPQTNTKKIPRWFVKFVLLRTQNKPDFTTDIICTPRTNDTTRMV